MTEDFDQVKKDDAAPAAAADETGAPAPETAAPAEPNGAPEPAEKKKKTGAGKKILVPAVIALCVVALFFVGLGVWGYSVTVSRRNLPNVYVGEVAVGGMTRAETEAALDALDWAAAESREQVSLACAFFSLYEERSDYGEYYADSCHQKRQSYGFYS